MQINKGEQPTQQRSPGREFNELVNVGTFTLQLDVYTDGRALLNVHSARMSAGIHLSEGELVALQELLTRGRRSLRPTVAPGQTALDAD